jgi:hypothetical protein
MTTGVDVPTHTTPSAHIQKCNILVAMKKEKQTVIGMGII